MLQFNTLAFANALVDGGMDRKTAETIAAAQHELISELAAKNLPSRDDVNDLRILIETRMVALTAANERIIHELRADLDSLRSASSEGIAEVKAVNAALSDTISEALSDTISRMQGELPSSLREPLLQGQKQELAKLREAVFDKMQMHQDRRDHSTFLMIRAIRNKLLVLGVIGVAALVGVGYFAMRYLEF
jgi:hypothetical protein